MKSIGRNSSLECGYENRRLEAYLCNCNNGRDKALVTALVQQMQLLVMYNVVMVRFRIIVEVMHRY